MRPGRDPVHATVLILVGGTLILFSRSLARVNTAVNSRFLKGDQTVGPLGFVLVGIGLIIVGLAVLLGLA
jgi:hypothetical protein